MPQENVWFSKEHYDKIKNRCYKDKCNFSQALAKTLDETFQKTDKREGRVVSLK